MKIRVQKQVIESILINLQPFLEKKDSSQITSHIFFEAKDNISIIKATDMEIGLSIKTENIKIEEEGSFTANGKKILDIIRILKDDEITIEIDKSTIVIKQDSSKFKLPIFDPTIFPKFPTHDDKPKITLDSMQLIQSLKKVSSAIDNNNPKFELNGALLNIKSDSTDIVGTDTRRLAIATIQNKSEKELSLIIPKKAIIEIQKLFLDHITIFYDETNIIITGNNYYFFSKLINGKFPDYARIIPASTRHSIMLPKKEMIESIKMITTISNEIKMIINPDTIIFNSLSNDNVEAKTQIEVKTGIDKDFDLNFNSRYILDFLLQCEDNEFELKLNEQNLPFVVKNRDFLTIIMPIIL